MSFREFIQFGENTDNIPKFELQHLLKNHKQIAKNSKPYVKNPIKNFKSGAYPYYLENRSSYTLKLKQSLIINKKSNENRNI